MDLTKQNNRGRRKAPEIDLQTMVYGKVPPQAREMEELILGAIMMEQDAFDIVTEIFKSPAVFYVAAHQQIFQAITNLHNKSVRPDSISVVQELKRLEWLDEVGGAYYIMQLTEKLRVSNVEHWARVVFQMFIKRELIKTGGFLVQQGFEDSTDPFELLDGAENAVLSIANNLGGSEVEHISNGLVSAIQEIEVKVKQYNETAGYISGVTSGFVSVDKITHGWQDSDLIILAARPSVGKTALALNLARNAAFGPKKTAVAVFSLEMSKQQLINRLLAAESGVNLEQIMKGKLQEHEQEKVYRLGVQPLSEAKLFIDDTAALNVFELRAKSRRLKSKHNIGLIIIDYLQLMSGTGENRGNREQEISHISRSLKALAKELKVPVIALSQLSREPEKRAGNNKMPVLSDLRESGAIEQDADSVIFLYRPDYYNGTSTGETNLRFAKHRNGILDTVKLKAQLWIQKFIEWDDPEIKSPIYPGFGLDKPLISQVNSLNGQLDDNDPF